MKVKATRVITHKGVKRVKETNIAHLRKQKGLSQAQLAQEASMTQSAIARLESRQRLVSGLSLGIAARIAKILGVHAEEILDDPEDVDNGQK